MKKDPTKVAAAYKGLLEKNKVIVSPELKIINADWQRWFRNLVLFFAPAFLIFLVQLQQGNSVQDALPILYLWLINTLIDITRKYLGENTYKAVPLDAQEGVKKNEIKAKGSKK
jgi:hypothetical protein